MSAHRYTRDVFISWDELHRDCRELCRRLLETGRTFDSIVAVTRGGLIPAAVVARELDVRLVDTICVVSYRGGQGQEQADAEVLKAPAGDGAGCLLLDDLVDTGKTASKIRELLPEAFFATVYAKPEGQPLTDLCIREIPQTTWVRFPWDTELSFAVPLVERDE
ncbi:MAG: xanthine phosphoribosyltransferase [Sandaracinaceae bacterium]|nr:xanthine phosphoribosyltransferase [Sandaracinaceae bacterium]